MTVGSSPSSAPSFEGTAPFAAAWIAEVLGLPAPRTSASFSAFTTDSRKIPASGLFVAIHGETMDGHDFIPAAIDAGATGILADASIVRERKLSEQHPGVLFFGVSNVQQSFRRIAQAWRRQFAIPVVLVAGANGKTTTKEFLSSLLRGKYSSVLKTIGSQNGFLGIPMTLVELRASHGAAVIEVGIDEIGAMAQHVPVVHPTHTVLTVIGPEHLEKLIDVPTVAREECLAFSETLRIGGQCVVNLDDEWISKEASRLPGSWTFSLRGSHADGTKPLVGRWLSEHGRSVLETSVQGESLALEVPLPGQHNAQNLLAAVATAAAIGLTASEIQKGLATFQGADGRSQIRKITPVSDALAICDYYNASPVSMGAAFQLLAQTGAETAVRAACLGDMKELGPEELRFHAELATPLMKSGASIVLLHGPRMKSLHDALKKSGFTGRLEHFDDLQELARNIRSTLPSGSVVLIKGSRSMKMETVWQELERA